MSLRLSAKLAGARVAGAVSRLHGGGGTSLPGKLLLRMQPNAIELLSARLGNGSVVLSATNGKTTTAAMAASVLRASDMAIVHNQAGANMAGGIASTLLAHARRDSELGLFEVDEFWLDSLIEQLRPRAIVLGNLFRDQLDRYGELEAVAERWSASVRRGAGAQATLVCNADDAMVADLGRERERVLYFGVEDDALVLPGMAHAADAKHCRRCGTPYEFEAVYLGHLGHYRCPGCGQQRPYPRVRASEVVLEGVRGASFHLTTPQGDADVRLEFPGLYNVYNALAAAALGVALNVPIDRIVDGLQAARAAFGRAETLQIDGRELCILLVKNPAGANEVLRTLSLENGEHDLLAILNDRTADGRDVSWIWDADFELLGAQVRHVTCAGTRAPELALRFKYAGVDPERIAVEPSLEAALRLALANRPDTEDGGTDETQGRRKDDQPAFCPPLYALPTYTAMLDLRELLVKRGEASSPWR